MEFSYLIKVDNAKSVTGRKINRLASPLVDLQLALAVIFPFENKLNLLIDSIHVIDFVKKNLQWCHTPGC